MMKRNFNDDVFNFIQACNKFNVEMIMVGGSAVNFYGYKRHSADIDFWINHTNNNLNCLKKALLFIGYGIEQFPDAVMRGEQNISLKFSPDLEIELITKFNPGKSFKEAFKDSKEYIIEGEKFYKWYIISYEDLIESKMKSGRPKDLLDIQELQRLNKKK